MPSPSGKLLALMQAGDMRALDQLARSYGERLLAVARRQCHLAADAEDAVQQALVAAGTGMTALRHEDSALAWLSTLVARNCFRLNRAAARHEELSEEPPCCADDPELVAERRELAATLGEALMAVFRTDRLVFLLSAEGLNSVELAEQFGLSHDAIRSRLKRTRAALRLRIGGDDTRVARGDTKR